MGCVVRLLEHAEVAAAEGSERWRLLAMAASRLDRRALARSAFAAWIRLDPANKLERDSTPPGIWQDYTAALLEVRGAELVREPQLSVDTRVTPVRPEASDLPRAPLPPRSDRDRARDFRFLAGLRASAAAGHGVGSVAEAIGGQLAVELQLSRRWWLGPHLGGLRFAVDGTGYTRPIAQLQTALDLGPAHKPWLSLTAGAGAVVAGGSDKLGSAALHVGVRYAPQLKGVVSLAIELADDVLLGGAQYSSVHVVSLQLSALFRPVRH